MAATQLGPQDDEVDPAVPSPSYSIGAACAPQNVRPRAGSSESSPSRARAPPPRRDRPGGAGSFRSVWRGGVAFPICA